MNVLHKALKNGSSDGESAGPNEHSPNSCSDDAVEPASSSDPDVSQPDKPTTQGSYPSFSDSQTGQSPGPESGDNRDSPESGYDNRLQSWFMVNDNAGTSPLPTSTPTNSLFQPDLVPVEAAVPESPSDRLSESFDRTLLAPQNVEDQRNQSYDELSTEDGRSRTPPDIQQMTSSQNMIGSLSETSTVLPDVQLNTPAVSILPSNMDVEQQFAGAPPDLTQSPRERPDILTSDFDTQNRSAQNVDLVVQELDVIRAVNQNVERDSMSETNMAEEDVDNARNAAVVESNSVDLVVQELDVVQGNEHLLAHAVTSLDILPANGDAAEAQTPDIASQQMSILHDIPVSRMDRNGTAGHIDSSFNEVKIHGAVAKFSIFNILTLSPKFNLFRMLVAMHT